MCSPPSNKRTAPMSPSSDSPHTAPPKPSTSLNPHVRDLARGLLQPQPGQSLTKTIIPQYLSGFIPYYPPYIILTLIITGITSSHSNITQCSNNRIIRPMDPTIIARGIQIFAIIVMSTPFLPFALIFSLSFYFRLYLPMPHHYNCYQ